MDEYLDKCNNCAVLQSGNFEQFKSQLKLECHCRVGIDEAGRGPVLGPMVYGAAVSPISTEADSLLAKLGVDDSKALTEQKRASIFEQMNDETDEHCRREVCYVTKVLSPHYISTRMLRRCKYSLNDISHDAAIELIRHCLDAGHPVAEVRSSKYVRKFDCSNILRRLSAGEGDKTNATDEISLVYVDTVGPPESYQQKLESVFPQLKIVVAKKADSLYPIVGAASIAAKVTRDRIVEHWPWPEENFAAGAVENNEPLSDSANSLKPADGAGWGSGYPADPTTKSYLEQCCDAVFGYATLVRFSWATTAGYLERKAVEVKWDDDGSSDGQPVAKKSRSLSNYFSKQKKRAVCQTDNDSECLPTEREQSSLILRHSFFVDSNIKSVTSL